jgi:hypothetical protein
MTGIIDFYDSNGDAISTTNIAHKIKWEKGYKCQFRKITVHSITWKDLFEKHCDRRKFKFVNIDTENTNYELLKSFPFNLCMPLCMCIEHDSKINGMMEILQPYGFRIIYKSGENIVVYRGAK